MHDLTLCISTIIRVNQAGDAVLALSFMHGGPKVFESDSEKPNERGIRDAFYHGDIYPVSNRLTISGSITTRADEHKSNFLVHVPKYKENSEMRPILWVADFGLSVDSGSEATTYATQFFYRAPELEGHTISYDKRDRAYRGSLMEKGDVYSLGLTIFTVRTYQLSP